MIGRLLDWIADRQRSAAGTPKLMVRVQEREREASEIVSRQRLALDTVTYRDLNRAAFGRNPWPREEGETRERE